MPSKNVVGKIPFTKETVQTHLAASWARTIAQMGGKKATFAETIGVHPDTVNNALAGNTVPELHTVLNSLFACPNSLDEVFGLYGFYLVACDKALSPDQQTMIDLAKLLTRFCEAMDDGRRDHRETIELAAQIRPLLPKLTNIVAEADEKRGLKAVA